MAEIQAAPGDKLRIAVQDLPAVAGDYVLDETGSISIPLIRQVKVAGLTYAQIEDVIARRLIEQDVLKNPAVTVQPLDLRPIYIIGEVREPGELTYRQGLTVFAAVSMAGGYTYRAKTGTVAITRSMDGREVTSVAGEDALLLPGDRIRVLESWF
ncbi:polysaccharide biosynthesis/export family protein [Parerythrobacter aurantius]|uniref:polysaccharide biosynthesis/export family protein n=1 Tax=Parerythrobacter aurantius TaxID=3127706 RepID=UPI0032453551